MIDLDQFVGLIFMEAHTHAHYVLHNQAYYAGLIFVVRRSSTKKCENWTPQKFPTIHYHWIYTYITYTYHTMSTS